MDKSKRAANFTKSEEEYLISLVIKHQEVIECKKTDATSAKAKEATWIKLAEEFNVGGFTYRDALTLRRKFENLKKRSKKTFADEKCYTNGTGGGGPPVVVINSVDEEIRSLIGEQMTGQESQYDCDAILIEDQLDVAESCQDSNIQIIAIEEAESIEEVEPSSDWSSYTPAMLRTNKAPQLMPSTSQKNTPCSNNFRRPKTNKRKTSDDVWCQVGKAKLDLIEEQRKYLKEDQDMKLKIHELNKKCIQEEHDLKIKLLELDIEIKKYKIIFYSEF